MNWVSVILTTASLAQSNPPFTETFGPSGEQKTISSGYVDCEGKSLEQTKRTMYELSEARSNEAAVYIMRLNGCKFVEDEGETFQIAAVRDQRCVKIKNDELQSYCDFEYFVFELKSKERSFYAVYAPIYE